MYRDAVKFGSTREESEFRQPYGILEHATHAAITAESGNAGARNKPASALSRSVHQARIQAERRGWVPGPATLELRRYLEQRLTASIQGVTAAKAIVCLPVSALHGCLFQNVVDSPVCVPGQTKTIGVELLPHRASPSLSFVSPRSWQGPRTRSVVQCWRAAWETSSLVR